MTIFRKSVLSAEKKCIFIGRGKENDILLRRTILDNYCMSNRLEAVQYLRELENQKIGRRNASKRNERKQNIHGYPLFETLILKKHAEGLWL